MSEQTGFDTEAVEALALALADVGGFGDEYRAEPGDGQWEFAPNRLKSVRTAQILLGITRAGGFELTKAVR